MKEEIEFVVLNRNARIAGFLYFLVIALGMLNNLFVLPNIIVPNDFAKTTSNILQSNSLYRLSIVLDVVMFVMVTSLAVSLYIVLKNVNRNLALMGFAFRFAESVLGGINVLLSLSVMILLNTKGFTAILSTEQIVLFVRFALELKSICFNVLIIFMGIGATIYCWLFYRSRYIPRIISVWGIVTYVSMTIVSFSVLLFSNMPSEIVIGVMAPSALFELLIGLWLCISGIKNLTTASS